MYVHKLAKKIKQAQQQPTSTGNGIGKVIRTKPLKLSYAEGLIILDKGKQLSVSQNIINKINSGEIKPGDQILVSQIDINHYQAIDKIG